MSHLPAPPPQENRDPDRAHDALRARTDRPRIEPELLWLRARPARPRFVPAQATRRCA